MISSIATGQLAPLQAVVNRKIILSFGLAALLIIGCTAFLAQSARFPETDFERLLFWMGPAAVYTFLLYRIWK